MSNPKGLPTERTNCTTIGIDVLYERCYNTALCLRTQVSSSGKVGDPCEGVTESRNYTF